MALLDKGDKVYIIVFMILVGTILFFYLNLQSKKNYIERQELYIEKLEQQIEHYKSLDTTYVSKRDSIKYNIIKKDSIIYKIKEEYEEQKNTISASNDSDVVNKFNELVWAE